MKFSCGSTRESRLAKEKQAAEAKAARLSEWHKKFLWWPTTTSVENDRKICQWLTFVERRYPWANAGYDDVWSGSWGVYGLSIVEYREITK